MTYVVVVTSKEPHRLFANYYLIRQPQGAAPRGRKKSKLPRPWMWARSYDPTDAYVFTDLIEAVKQATRAQARFGKHLVGQVRVFDTGALVALQTVWPSDDLVTAIGLLAFDEANVEAREHGA